jgi:hypothetical protein
LNGSRKFEFSFLENIASPLENSLECELDDKRIFIAKRIDSNNFECNFTSNIHTNVTFWFKDVKNIRSRLSSNYLPLYFLNYGQISFDSSSKQFGNTMVQISPIIKLNVANVPTKFRDRILCDFNGTTSDAIVFNSASDIYQCNVSSSNAGYGIIGMKFKRYNSFKVKNVHSTFSFKHSLTYKVETMLSTNSYLSLILNGTDLILSQSIKNNCDDILITWKGIQIPVIVEKCGSEESAVKFQVQEAKIGLISDYDLYYGNSEAISMKLSTYGLVYSIFPTATPQENSVLTLNNNQLSFGFFKLFSIKKLDPVASLTTNSTIKLWNDYKNIDFNGRVRFEVRYNSERYDAIYSESQFVSNIYSTSGKRINATLWAIYTPTQEYVPASNDIFYFTFMGKPLSILMLDLVTMNYLYPFIDKFTLPVSTKNTTVQITVASNLFTQKGLFCSYSHHGNVRYSPAEFVSGNLKLIQCSMEFNQLALNSELIQFNLYMNVSTEDNNLNFILSSNALTYVILKEPIEINFPRTITNNFNQYFNLNFSNPQNISNTKLSYDSYKVKLIPEYSVSNSPRFIVCNFQNITPQCIIQNLVLTHSPMRLDYQLQVSSPHFADVVNFTMSSNIFRENITFLTELPFVGEALNVDTNLTIKFKINKKLHPSYSFYCKIFSIQVPVVRDSNEDVFSCYFKPRGYEEVVDISLHLNSSIEGLGGIISNQDSSIQMVTLKFVPEFSRFSENLTLTVRKNNSIPFIVPPKYGNYSYQIISANSQVFNCSISGGSLNCQKTNISLEQSVDIHLLNFKIQYKTLESNSFNDFVDIRQGLILHENHEVSEIFPLAALIGNNMNLTLKFDESAMKNNFIQRIEFYCQYNQNRSLSVKLDDKTLNCPVKYSDHKSNTIQMKTYFKVPELSGDKEIFITLADSLTKFHYLNSTNIQFSSLKQTRFFYTSTEVNFNVNITTFIPSNLFRFIVTKLSDASGFSPTNNYFGSVGDNHQFNSNTSTQFGGKKQLTLWFKQNDYSFQLSNNSLEVIFAVPSYINGLSPLAAIVNRTTTMIISTTFDASLDYGTVEYRCKYGANPSDYESSTIAKILTNGDFQCDVNSTVEGKVFLSLWMSAKGIERKISVVDETLNFITSDFLNPSFGLPTGGLNVTIQEYNRIPSNISFVKTNLESYLFHCEKALGSLYCVTPAIPTYVAPVFDSYDLKFSNPALNGTRLSVKWINYEKREISSFYPQVISSGDLTFPMNITLDKNATMIKGSLILVYGYGTNYRKDVSYGRLVNEINVEKMLSLLPSDPKGTHPIQLYYSNEDIIEFRSMIPISNSKNITILTKSPIKFLSNNMGYTNQMTNFTILLDGDSKLLEEHKSKVECKIGNSFVKTYYNENKPSEYICSSSSNVELVTIATLWYKDANAYKGEIEISSNPLDIIFVKHINVSSISPFASISFNQNVKIHTTLVNDFYGNKVTYECVFDNLATVATLSGSSFDCIVSRKSEKSYSFSEFISLNIKSETTKISIPLTLNNDSNSEFFFLKKVETVSMFPFAQGHKINGIGSLSSQVSIDVSENLLLSRGLFCKYSSTNEGVFYSKAEFKNSSKNSLTCDIYKQNLTNVLEILRVSLWMNATDSLIFDFSTNDQQYLFIREPLFWNTSKLLNEFNFENSNQIQFLIPNSFKYQLYMAPNLDASLNSTIDCDYNGMIPVCLFKTKNLATITSFPSDINFTLSISHGTSGKVSNFAVDYKTYYKRLTIEHVKPYIVSYHERLGNPVRIISNIDSTLNSKRFKFVCKCKNFFFNFSLFIEFNIDE